MGEIETTATTKTKSGSGSDSGSEERQLLHRIAKILDEAKSTNATHPRKLKELSSLQLRSKHRFATALSKCLTPIFLTQRRTAPVERVVRFVSAFACSSGQFLEEFLGFLLVAALASNKTARFRACQIISEIIARLPDDAEVSDELWDEVIESMKVRVRDKVPLIRTFAVRALSRFANDAENSDVLDLLLEVLPEEHNAEVRKTIVLALPPSSETLVVIIECTLDVSESVRKAAYFVLANKFPLQSLSIKHRTIILQRGLADRSEAVSKECLKLMRDEWLLKCCNDDPIELLKYLDVETYESVGEIVMSTLLNHGLVKICDDISIRQYIVSAADDNEGEPSTTTIHLMEPELALYWKNVCRHLQRRAQAKGSDAASTSGTEAAVYASEATDNNDHLERILPATISDFISLVQAHIDAGVNQRFASRQLLLLGSMLDFSDFTTRKVASAFVQDLLRKPEDHEVDDKGITVVIGDGINLGGDKDWADAVSNLLRKVHASPGEFEEIVVGVVEELARPCRERAADSMHWMHTLAVAGLLLEHAKSFQWLRGKAIEPAEILRSLLLPGAKHADLDVQRVAIRCLGLFGLLEKKPNDELVKQLRLSFVNSPALISIMACKALFDLCMWHDLLKVDRTASPDHLSQPLVDEMKSNSPNLSSTDEILNADLLSLFNASLNREDDTQSLEGETLSAILAEGFSKVLLLSESYPNISTSLHPLLVAKLVSLYFSSETTDMQRLKQCLSVFFEHYPCISADHKRWLSEAFILVMRSMWPGISGNPGGSSVWVSNKRKRAVQASRFMLQMMQSPLYAKKSQVGNENGDMKSPEAVDESVQPSTECGEEGLALRIAAEVASYTTKKTPAERSYIAALCRILGAVQFRSSEQTAIRLMRRLLVSVIESVSAEKDIARDLTQMASHLKSLDGKPDEEISKEEADMVLGRLELNVNLDALGASAAIPCTPGPQRSSRQPQRRRRARDEDTDDDSSDKEFSTVSIVVGTVGVNTGPRSQRASKTAAMSKMTATQRVPIDETENEEDEGSGVTSDEYEDSDE